MFLICSIVSAGQENKSYSSVEISGLAGFLAAHHPELEYLSQDHIYGFELDWKFRVDGSKDFHHNYNFPYWGLSVNVYDLGSKNLGTGIALRAFYDLPLNKSRTLFIRPGFGLGYVDKPFDPINNFQNSATSTKLNATIGLEISGNIKIGNQSVFRPGISIHHFSNGASRYPNKGLNVVLLKMAFALDLRNTGLPERRAIGWDKKSNEFSLGMSAGRRASSENRKTLSYFKVYNFYVNYLRQYSNKSSFGLELGANLDDSIKERSDSEKSHNTRIYAALQYMLNFNKLGFRFQSGFYLIDKDRVDGISFFRYHLVYRLPKIEFFGGLKSHFAVASNIELGLAYRIK